MTTLREYLLAYSDRYSDPKYQELSTTIRRNTEAVEVLTKELKRLDRGIEKRRAEGRQDLVSKWESERDAVAAALDSSAVAAALADSQREAMKRNVEDRHRQVLEITYRAVLDGVESYYPGLLADLIIDVRTGHSVYEVQQWTGEWRFWHQIGCRVDEGAGRFMGKGPRSDAYTCEGCEPVTAKEPRFGYDATVYAPEPDWRWAKDAERTVKRCTVNWGTLGSLSASDARSMIHVHTVATMLAERLDAALNEPLIPTAQVLLDEPLEVAA